MKIEQYVTLIMALSPLACTSDDLVQLTTMDAPP